jgi:hypothetical protein
VAGAKLGNSRLYQVSSVSMFSGVVFVKSRNIP